MVKFDTVVKKYNKVNVVDNLNFEIQQGQFVVLIGPSGCGKTTTLKMINRLIEPTSGQIYIEGKDITKANAVLLRRTIGYVIQQIGLFPNMTIRQNIEVVPKLLGWSADKRKQRTEELLRLVGMEPEQYIDRYPKELSGGQQQRIGVLRALAVEPPLILMDEPFGALDPITRESLQDEIKKLQKKLNKTVVFVTHDMDEAIKLADVIVIMQEGKIVQADSPEKLLRSPVNDFVADFIGKHKLNTENEIDIVEDVMKSNPFTVTGDKGIVQSIALMKSKGASTVIIVDNDNRPEGIVTIEEISRHGKSGKSIKELMDTNFTTVKTDSDAKEAFEIIINRKLDFIIAVDHENAVKGIVTKTSMVKALAKAVWKDDSDE